MQEGGRYWVKLCKWHKHDRSPWSEHVSALIGSKYGARTLLTYASENVRWKLDKTEGLARMRKRFRLNDKFYNRYGLAEVCKGDKSPERVPTKLNKPLEGEEIEVRDELIQLDLLAQAVAREVNRRSAKMTETLEDGSPKIALPRIIVEESSESLDDGAAVKSNRTPPHMSREPSPAVKMLSSVTGLLPLKTASEPKLNRQDSDLSLSETPFSRSERAGSLDEETLLQLTTPSGGSEDVGKAELSTHAKWGNHDRILALLDEQVLLLLSLLNSLLKICSLSFVIFIDLLLFYHGLIPGSSSYIYV